MEKLPVIFRREKSDGSVTAVFPTLPADVNGRYFTVYAHIGQHGSGSFGWYNETRAAKPDEYADLLQELRGIYTTRPAANPDIYGEPVELVIYQRMTSGHRAAFNAAARGLVA